MTNSVRNSYEYPLISVIVLTYNDFSGVNDTIKSVLEQNYPQLELIISDDGSDNFVEQSKTIEAYINESKCSNLVELRITHLPRNVGTVKNANHAISSAKGKYIKLLGAGDYFIEDSILLQYYHEITRFNGLVLCGQAVQCNSSKELLAIVPQTQRLQIFGTLSPQQQLESYLMNFKYIATPTVLFKTELFKMHGLFDEEYKYIEDYPYWLRIASEGVKMYVLPILAIMYRNNGVSSDYTHNLSSVYMDEYKNVKKDTIKHYTKSGSLYQFILKYKLNREMSYRRFTYSAHFIPKRLRQFLYADLMIFRIYEHFKLFQWKVMHVIKPRKTNEY